MVVEDLARCACSDGTVLGVVECPIGTVTCAAFVTRPGFAALVLGAVVVTWTILFVLPIVTHFFAVTNVAVVIATTAVSACVLAALFITNARAW